MDKEPLSPSRDPRISEVFYFFKAMTTLVNGRTVGRKIGVVQEIILRKYLEANHDLARRMYLERFLRGHSGAEHKVEFSWYSIAETAEAGQGVDLGGVAKITAIDLPNQRVRVSSGGRSCWLREGDSKPRTGVLRDALDSADLDIRVWSDDATLFVDVIDTARLLASLESKRVGAQRFKGSDKLGSGIQTIEKAKQASLVAIDLDIGHNGTVKPLQDSTTKTLISLVALGNGVHWTQKDRAVMSSYIDYAFLVKDESIIRYAKYVLEGANEDDDPLEYFMSYFVGMKTQGPDDFAVSDSDFEVITPAEEARPLVTVLADHVLGVDG